MTVYDFESLYCHLGHDVEVVEWVDTNQDAMNVAIVCNDCNEVLVDFDDEPVGENK